MMIIKETDIVRSILEYLSYRHVFAWRNNSGAVKYEGKGKTRFHRFGLKGSSDIIGVYKGKFLAIEVKKPGGVVTDAQEDFLDTIRTNGGIAFVAYSVDDVIKYLDKNP